MSSKERSCRHKHVWVDVDEKQSVCPQCGEEDVTDAVVYYDWDEMDWVQWAFDLLTALKQSHEVKSERARKENRRQLIDLILTGNAAAVELMGDQILPWETLKNLLNTMDPDGSARRTVVKRWNREVISGRSAQE